MHHEADGSWRDHFPAHEVVTDHVTGQGGSDCRWSNLKDICLDVIRLSTIAQASKSMQTTYDMQSQSKAVTGNCAADRACMTALHMTTRSTLASDLLRFVNDGAA